MYLDPGFGSMVIQLLLAGFAVLGTCFYFFRDKIKSLFKKNKAAEDTTASPDANDEGAEE